MSSIQIFADASNARVTESTRMIEIDEDNPFQPKLAMQPLALSFTRLNYSFLIVKTIHDVDYYSKEWMKVDTFVADNGGQIVVINAPRAQLRPLIPVDAWTQAFGATQPSLGAPMSASSKPTNYRSWRVDVPASHLDLGSISARRYSAWQSEGINTMVIAVADSDHGADRLRELTELTVRQVNSNR
jgi:hypothetical protein